MKMRMWLEEVRYKTRAEICPPSSEEIRRHEKTHMPFRNWCAHCVRGKSKSPPHRKTSSEEKGIPTVVIDYTFMTTADGGDDEAAQMPIVVMLDCQTGYVAANLVPRTGAA